MRPAIALSAVLIVILSIFLVTARERSVSAESRASAAASDTFDSQSQSASLEPAERPPAVESIAAEAPAANGPTTEHSAEEQPRPVEDAGAHASTVQHLRVISEVDGDPVAGVTIKVIGKDVPRTAGVVTKQNGRATVRRNPTVMYHLSRDGYVRRIVRLSELPAATGTVTDDEPAVIELRPVAKLSGKIGLGLEPRRSEGTARTSGGHKIDAPDGFVLVRDRSPEGALRRDAEPKHIYRAGDLWDLEGVLVDLAADGSWFLEVAIPYDVEVLRDLSIEHAYADRSTRSVAVVPILRPGDDLVLGDRWRLDAPLELTFESSDARALARGHILSLWRPEFGATREQPEVTLRLDANAAATVAHLPAGSWDFAVDVRRAACPSSWFPAGTFFRRAGTEREALPWSGSARAVFVIDEERSPGWSVRLGVVVQGAPLERGRFVRPREVWSIPSPPDHGAYEFVAVRFARGSIFESRNTGRTGSVPGRSGSQEVLRVPLDRARASFELRIPPSTREKR